MNAEQWEQNERREVSGINIARASRKVPLALTDLGTPYLLYAHGYHSWGRHDNGAFDEEEEGAVVVSSKQEYLRSLPSVEVRSRVKDMQWCYMLRFGYYLDALVQSEKQRSRPPTDVLYFVILAGPLPHMMLVCFSHVFSFSPLTRTPPKEKYSDRREEEEET